MTKVMVGAGLEAPSGSWLALNQGGSEADSLEAVAVTHGVQRSLCSIAQT